MRGPSKLRPKDSKQRDAELLRFAIREHLKPITDYLAIIERKHRKKSSVPKAAEHRVVICVLK